MRPPEFTGGNPRRNRGELISGSSFNEAAGIHRRKHRMVEYLRFGRIGCFNEAAGIHRRKP